MVGNKACGGRALRIAVGITVLVSLVLLLIGTAMGGITRTGLVAEYHFDDSTNDSSGNGNNGIIYGASFIDGKYGKALSFNGVDNKVRVPNSNSLNPVGGITLEALVRGKGTTSTWYSIISKMESSTQNSGYELYLLQQNTPRFAIVSYDPKIGQPMKVRVGDTTYNTRGDSGPPSSSYNPPTQSGSTISAETWTHIAGTYDGKQLILYINGKFDSFLEKSGFLSTSTKDDLWIGSWKNADYFNGDIDEVRIYNRALTDVEIKANFEASAATALQASTSTPVITATQPATSVSPVVSTSTPSITTVQPTTSQTPLRNNDTEANSAANVKAPGFTLLWVLTGLIGALLLTRWLD